MSAILSRAPGGLTPSGAPLQFGQAALGSDGSLLWLLKRNCSLSPHQTLAFYLSLCVVSMLVAVFCWMQGATYVMSFAGVEMAVVGIALAVYARHAADREIIRLQPGCLSVCRVCGGRTENVEFASAWVRVEPHEDQCSLVGLSGQGQRILVGRFLRPDRRRMLADELRAALRRTPTWAADPTWPVERASRT